MRNLHLTILSLVTIISLTACNNYGKKVIDGHIEVYYKNGISEEQAKFTASFIASIDRSQNNNYTQKKSFQLCKQNDTICLCMVTNKEKMAAIQDKAFMALGNLVSESVFNGAPVNVDLTNENFESLKMLHYKKLDLNKMDNPE